MEHIKKLINNMLAHVYFSFIMFFMHGAVRLLLDLVVNI